MKSNLALIALALALVVTAHAQVPSILNYQGRVSIGGSNYNGNGQFKFALVNADGSTTYWNNAGTTGEPASSVSLVVTQGLYSTILGDTATTNMAAIPAGVFSNNDLRLRVWFRAGTNGAFMPFAPDQRLGSAPYAARAGALKNDGATGSGSFVGGGEENTASTFYATVSGGYSNSASGNHATVGAGLANVASGDKSTVGGGSQNTAITNFATIAGGFSNSATRDYAMVGGGGNNTASGFASMVSGGTKNTAGSDWATVSGGFQNTNNGRAGFIGGGSNNSIPAGASNAVVGGGSGNTASGESSTVGGGELNTASSFYATVPGGTRSKATNSGAFVWSGVSTVDTVSTNTNSFTVRAPGGARFLSTTATNAFVGVILTNAATAWASLSDSNSKTDFETIKPREILAKVAGLPVTAWHYKHDPKRRYIGPMSQDFRAAFGLGSDDKTISTLDSDGVMYAAIQGLVEELHARDARIERLENELKEIRRELGNLPPSP
jgi:hypothetical protein